MSAVFLSSTVYQSVSKKVIYPNVLVTITVAIAFSSVSRSSAMDANFIMAKSRNLRVRWAMNITRTFFVAHRRWFIIKDTYLTYMRPETYEVRFPMLVDRAFDIVTGFRHAGTPHGIKISNLQRSLVMKCRNKRDCDEWTQHLLNLKEKSKVFNGSSPSRFNSFAPIREKQLAYW